MAFDPITGTILGTVGQLTNALNSAQGVVNAAQGGSTPISDATQMEIWHIKAKGKVDEVRKKLNPMGDHKINKYYHNALEQGRLMEKSIGDAQHWLEQKKRDLMEKITGYFHMNSLAIDGKLGRKARAIKYVADSIAILKQVNEYQQDIIAMIQAVTTNIGIMQSMLANMMGMIQSNLNALAALMNEICNWGLPDLPAIPNLFADTIWHWNGFNFFPLASFKPNLKFDYNFAFNQCYVHLPNINIFRNYPSSLETYGGLAYGTPLFVPPLGGLIPDTGKELNDPNFIEDMRNYTIGPYYEPTRFNTNTSMWGAIPNPGTIISNYQMPAETYVDNIVSIVPELRDVTVRPGDPDYDSPNYEVRNATLRKALCEYVTLERVVDSGFDPNLTAAWLFYLNAARNGRAGSWIENFAAAYATYISPSLTSLTTNKVPWNAVLGSKQVIITKVSIANNIATLTLKDGSFGLGESLAVFGLDNASFLNNQVLRVSEVSGSTVSVAFVHDNYISDATEQGVAISTSAAPSSIPLLETLKSLDPESQANVFWQLSYLEASVLGYVRTQRWDDYADNSYVSSFSGTDLDYKATAIDLSTKSSIVLGEGQAEYPVDCSFPTAIGNILQQVIPVAKQRIVNTPTFRSKRPQYRYIYDQFAQSKEVDRFTQFWREFNANLQLLLLQDSYVIQFVCSYPEVLDSAIDPLADISVYERVQTDAVTRNRNWVPGFPVLKVPKASVITYSTSSQTGGSGWSGDTFNAETFLARPDIQQLPIPVQMAMLRTNQGYASLLRQRGLLQTAFNEEIATAQRLIQDFSMLGFRVSATGETQVSVGNTGTLVTFQKTEFDYTHNVTSATTFTIQNTGSYAMLGEIHWGEGEVGTRTVNILCNGNSIASFSTDGMTNAPVTLPFSSNLSFNQGDVITVSALHNLATGQTILRDSYFSVMLYNADKAAAEIPANASVQSTTNVFTAGANLAPLTAVTVNVDGNVVAIDPLTVEKVDSKVVYPFVEGVTISTGVTGQTVEVASQYGDIFSVAGASLTVGALLYAGEGGVLTQDFDTIMNTCKWVVVVGRAVAVDAFIFEPQAPTRTVLGF